MMFSWNNPMVKGVLIGGGASLVGFAVYKHNEEKVDAFLNRHGVKVKTPTAGFETMSVEDLMRTKETIEDLIAEKELQEQSVTVESDFRRGQRYFRDDERTDAQRVYDSGRCELAAADVFPADGGPLTDEKRKRSASPRSAQRDAGAHPLSVGKAD